MSTLPSGFFANLTSWVGGPIGRRVAQWSAWLPRIETFGAELSGQPNEALRKHYLALRYRAKSGEDLAELLPETFALTREAGLRALDMRHFDVQLLGGIAMHHRSIAEMQTGEGKTLTATLAMTLMALPGKGAHLATVNDYLARRDADWMRPLYEMLGLTVGVIETPMDSDARRKSYACDVTYGTAKEFGFDFLRDRLLIRRRAAGSADLMAYLLGQKDQGGELPVQRKHFFCLVDEADSILIDEARTPLIISALPTQDQKDEAELYRWGARHAATFIEEDDYTFEAKTQKIELTGEGRRKVRNLPRGSGTELVGMLGLYDTIEMAIRAGKCFIRDRHYVVQEGEIVIVDEFTGRLAEGRRWRDGLHQAIEAKEQIEVGVATGHAARVTVQDYFQRYEHLAGMTGTGRTSGRELLKIYTLRVVPVPTNKPPIRKELPTRVFGDRESKEQAIIENVLEVNPTGRPILIGTRSIDKSMSISKKLTAQGIKHQVLTAYQVDKEAEIVAAAGQRGKVTVSTNMAGRGTDIRLGDGVRELGGLHVICTELHDSARIDRQLLGRCGRQGDPGTWQQFLALDDDILLMGLGPDRAEKLKAIGADGGPGYERYARLFYRAQRKIESRHFRDRRLLLHQERERKKVLIQMGQDPYLDAPS